MVLRVRLPFLLLALPAAAWLPSPASSQPVPAGEPVQQIPQQIQQQLLAPQMASGLRPEISVRTDKGIYRSGERPRISGRMLFGVGIPATGFARIKVYEKGRAGTGETVRYNNIVEVRGGEFSDDGFVVQIPREGFFQFSTIQVRYPVQVLGITNAPNPPEALTEFLGEEVGIGRMLYFIGGSMFLLIYVLVMVYYAFMRTPTKQAATTMLIMTYTIALVFLALPFLSPLLIYLSSDLEALLRTSPVGFLKAPLGRPEETQWVVNIGGVLTPSGALKGGIAIPLLVLVLSMLGAAINMLRRLPDFLKKYDVIPDAPGEQESVAGEELRSDLFKYFVYILSAPFIAMIAFSLMVIADYTNPHALSIVAFSVGFISDTVVETIMGKARTMFAGKEGGQGGQAAVQAGEPK